MSSNIIAIVGATGNQGSSVAHTFLALPHWQVRCLTRNPSSPAAQALSAAGAEVVAADLEDPASLDRAFSDVTAVFLNTDFWVPFAAACARGVPPQESITEAWGTEVRHAKNAALAAAKQPSLRRFVYSALGPMARGSGGKYPHCAHWESKAAAADFMEKEVPELQGKLSMFYAGAYHDNALLYPQQYEGLDGWNIVLPDAAYTRMPVLRAKDASGPYVRALIEDEEPGVKLEAYDCLVSAQEAVDTWAKVTGKQAKLLTVSSEEMHRITGIPDEVLDGARSIAEFGYMAGVEGKVLRPEDLKNKVPGMAWEDILRQRGIDNVLATAVPRLF
ncbi:hypothetical protein B0I35DRAFT_277731 [Stachybotrys elegans]|uniref:NmrA-like domain-containing protein n=1 Tax=Stachybotrys elegans TaxID=80388 RepID=A0A8K0SNQ1_9HYPO|nr:hypothetical protein B0I35DRAFT_277731 [Stachybotrys elegans]